MHEDPLLVSIVIPCYNTEDYIAEAIESALRQSYDPVEVIVVDDGSTDGSLDVIKSFGERITWRTGENHGVSAARNRGIETAEGEFVKFLDADDVLSEDAVETQVRQIRESERERVVVFGDGRKIGPEGRVQGCTSFRRKRADENPIAYILEVNPGAPYPLHRRDYLKEVSGFDEDLPWAEDYDLHLRLQLADIHLEYHPTNVVYVRQHDGDHRLTNCKEKEYEQNPWAPYQRGKDREQKIREAYQGELPDAVLQHLAKGTWGAGRRAMKAGHPEVAKQYFARAKELHPQHITSSSTVYRCAVALLGPIGTERIVKWIRRVNSQFGTA